MLPEDLVYLGTKALLRDRGWVLLAGQPPDGCDNLPVVEVKWPGRLGIGSHRAFKPDLIAAKDGLFLLVECKPDHSEGDVAKLHEILSDSTRVQLLYRELQQRHLLERRRCHATLKEFREGLRGAIAHSGQPREVPGLAVICVEDADGAGRCIAPPRDERLRLAFTGASRPVGVDGPRSE